MQCIWLADGSACSARRGNQGRLAASAARLSRLPPDLATSIAIANPVRIYRI
jgi:hypothetical protein